MAQSIRDVMTSDPQTVATSTPVRDAAKVMAEADVGPVLVLGDDGNLHGIVTDRDIAVRVVAEGRDPNETTVGDIASTGVTTLGPDDTVDKAIQLMRGEDIRRLPVVENGRPVGIVSLGDLSVSQDVGQTLADISAASPNN